VDKFGLYEISKYCDTLVYNGEGGLEPRFTCNLLINSREDASKVINDMSSIFRGLTYYARGTIFATQDREISPNQINTVFTNANVENGDFIYSSTSKKQRHSIAIIRYNDPKNFYKPAIEYVENFDAIRKYGIREVELTAFGCTSKGQALRLGRWALLSDTIESEKISFNAGLEASYLVPGDVFKIFDKNKKYKRYGGRAYEIKNINDTGSKVVLDSTIDVESTVEYKISFVTPSYVYDPTVVSGLNSNDFSGIRRSFIQQFNFSGFQTQTSGSKMIVDLYTGFDYSGYLVTGNPVWMMELSDRYLTYTGSRYFSNTSYDYYRVLNIKEEDINRFNVEGIQYNPQKYTEIESGLLFQK
ncbi:MAG: phage tail protein, partial [Nanoarchaeota archaeon]